MRGHPPVRITDPAAEPIPLADVMAHLRVDGPEEGIYIAGLVLAAYEYLDGPSGILGRHLLPQVWQQDFDGFAAEMVIDLTPVRAVRSVTWRNASGAMIPVEGARLMTSAGRVFLCAPVGQDWPAAPRGETVVRVTVEAGYPRMPMPIRQAILLLVGHWYANREAVAGGGAMTAIPLGVERLITPYRRPAV
ncbi:head-tail connector protein [Falsirhodobacter halotolerans]|uniref:head-tail connector protein n=1 Tax=Falsirhodobacter halotolerans TaxID=1146892 RepID=UPI001FD4EA56|nr:head-tail connector protein [Falsirhodobacter halotolerans]MCJ8139510.1 head-tail connector protein [Falsirhodobacter halotolerans]